MKTKVIGWFYAKLKISILRIFYFTHHFLSMTVLNLCPQQNEFKHHWIKTGVKLNVRHRWFDLQDLKRGNKEKT